MPGQLFTYRALSLAHSLFQPVLMSTASPACSVIRPPVGDLAGLARPDELFRPQAARGLHGAARAALAARSPLRRAALALGRHAPALRRGGGHPCQTEYCGEDDYKEGTWHGRSPLR